MECRVVVATPSPLLVIIATAMPNPFLEEKGGRLVYSMAKLKEADREWHIAIVGGCEWEILSSDMDIEEPDAAHIIALALNT